jgi:hypothetical protein
MNAAETFLVLQIHCDINDRCLAHQAGGLWQVGSHLSNYGK